MIQCVFEIFLCNGRTTTQRSCCTCLNFQMQVKKECESTEKSCGRIRCYMLLPGSEVEDRELSYLTDRRSGFIQISPTKEGPWTTVRLNYAAPAACWRLGNSVVASEVSVMDDHRYVDIRSLVSLRNSTDFALEFCLKLKGSTDGMNLSNDTNEAEKRQMNGDKVEKDEYFETEEYDPSIGWVSSSARLKQEDIDGSLHKVILDLLNVYFVCVAGLM